MNNMTTFVLSVLLAIVHVTLVYGCNKAICVNVYFSGQSIDIGGHGTYSSIAHYFGLSANELPGKNIYNVAKEPMRSKRSTNQPHGIPKCTKEAWCFNNKGVQEDVLEPSSYKHTYKVEFEQRLSHTGHGNYWQSVGGFESDNQIAEFVREAMKNAWFRLIHGRQFHDVKYTEGKEGSSCPNVYGGGSGYVDEVKSCHTLCTDLGCQSTCWDNRYKPKAICKENSVFSTVPELLKIQFTKGRSPGKGDILGDASINIHARSVHKPPSQNACSSHVENFFRALSFIPYYGHLFGLSHMACNLAFSDSATAFSDSGTKYEVPEDTTFIPARYASRNHQSLDVQNSKGSYYSCSKCWPSDPSEYSINSTDVLGVSFPATEEGTREGNHCSLCFVQQEILDDKIDFVSKISQDCQTLADFVLPVASIVKILPSKESEELKKAQENCMLIRSSARSHDGDSTPGFSVAAAAGTTFAATAVLFVSAGFVVHKLKSTKSIDPVIETFKA